MQLTTGIFSDSFSPIVDGVANVTRNYAYWLNRLLGPSYIIVPKFPGYNDEEEINILRHMSCPVPGRAPYRMTLASLDIPFNMRLKEIPFDLVHAHSPVVGSIALRVARRRDIPIVASFHSKLRDNFLSYPVVGFLVDRVMTSRIIQFYRAVDEVWVPNRRTVETLKEYGFEGTVEVVPNGIDIQPDVDKKRYIDRINREWNLHPDEKILLYIGQHVWEKNLKTLIEALSIVKTKEQAFRMVFIGEGYAGKGMEELVHKLNLSDNVQFMGTVRDREIVASCYCRADLFLFPSLYDTSPLTMREAAAFELPVLMVDGSTASEPLVDGENGFLAENTPEQYAEKIITLLDRPDVIRRAGRGAYQSLYQSWEDVLGEVKDRYLRLVAKTSVA